jgi:8-oxo-dGTP pyrophosphatase MutT (NUDIX family)
MRQQVGALPIRWNGDELSVLLVTSRDTQRWIIPKGWRMRGRSDADAAAQEALEEAGVRGRVRAEPIGRYHYLKRLANAVEDCQVTTYLLEVVDELVAFPEMDERRRGWFTPAEAADCADDLGLRDILRDLEARLRAERSGAAASPKAKAGKAKAAKADVDGLKPTKAKAAKGKASKSKASKLEASEPEATKPKASKPKAAKPKASKLKASKPKVVKTKASKSKRATIETQTLAEVGRAASNADRADAAPADADTADGAGLEAKLPKRKAAKSAKAKSAAAKAAKANPTKTEAAPTGEPDAVAAGPEHTPVART